MLEIHPLANAYPDLSEKEYQKLKEDIQAVGHLQKPIVLVDGKIFDGRHRYKACLELGVEPVFEEIKESDLEILGTILTNYNKQYRKLSTIQRACVAVELEPTFREETKNRQIGAASRGGKSKIGNGKVLSDSDRTLQVKKKGKWARDFALIAVGGGDHNTYQKVKKLKEISLEKFEKAKVGKMTEHDIDEFLGNPIEPKKRPMKDILIDYSKYNDLSRFGRMYSRVVGTIYRGEFIEKLNKQEREAVIGLLTESMDKKAADMASKSKLTKSQVFQVASVPFDKQIELVKKFADANKNDEEAFNAFREHIQEFIDTDNLISGVLKSVKNMK